MSLSSLFLHFMMSFHLYNNALALTGGCEDEFIFVNKELDWSSAETKCLDTGYEGLGILLTTEQSWRAANLILTGRNQTTNIWISLRYTGENGTWKYKRDEKWLYAPKETNWAHNEPADTTRNMCARIVKTVFNIESKSYNFTWKSTNCSDLHFAVCQKATSHDRNIGKMRLIQKLSPISKNIKVIITRSLAECALLCTSKCFCTYLHYSSGECRLLRFYTSSLTRNYSIYPGAIYGKLFIKGF